MMSIANASGHTKFISIYNEKCMTQPTLINLHPNDSSLSDCNWNRTHNSLVHKRTLYHLAKLDEFS